MHNLKEAKLVGFCYLSIKNLTKKLLKEIDRTVSSLSMVNKMNNNTTKRLILITTAFIPLVIVTRFVLSPHVTKVKQVNDGYIAFVNHKKRLF
jgi:hypothetical protein